MGSNGRFPLRLRRQPTVQLPTDLYTVGPSIRPTRHLSGQDPKEAFTEVSCLEVNGPYLQAKVVRESREWRKSPVLTFLLQVVDFCSCGLVSTSLRYRYTEASAFLCTLTEMRQSRRLRAAYCGWFFCILLVSENPETINEKGSATESAFSFPSRYTAFSPRKSRS